MREVIGKSKIDEALTVGKAKIQQDCPDLATRHSRSIRGWCADRHRSNSRTSIHPEAVAAAFKDVASAKEDREKLINQAHGYRNDLIPRANGEAAQEVNQAQASRPSPD